jgi:serine/threonine-protein kinase
MGEVLLAHDTELDRQVAIKVMSPELATNASKRKRFRNEARAASGLVHPNVCVIHEVGETQDKRAYIAMEYVEGDTLDSILQKRRLRMREVIHIGLKVAEALEAARQRKIVHRDIKPSNIMIGQRGIVKVLDFGLAKSFGNEALSMTSNDTSILRTQSGVLLGTPHYMSPEQALGLELCHRSDLFSLGVVLYEMVAGQRPFLGRTVGEIMNHIINQQPAPLGVESPFSGPSLEGIIFKCLAKKLEDRYQTAHDLVEALDQLRMEVEATTEKKPQPAVAAEEEGCGEDCTCVPPADAKWGRKKAVLVAALTGAAVLVLSGLAYLVIAPEPEPTTGNSTTHAGQSIAVLPFDNFSSDQSSEYLSDGLTEEITSALSRIPGLKVAARNSAFAFKGKKEDLRKVAATLGVSTILEGSMRLAGSQIRVTASLINAVDGAQMFSEQYDRPVDDVIAVQEEIARKIAERLQLAIAGEAPARGFTPSAEAHQAYLQARHLWNLRGKENLEKAERLFHKATELQPDYALAYSGLASCYLLLAEYSMQPLDHYLPKLYQAARKAQELDPKSAEALAVLGMVSQCQLDFASSARLFREALSYNPNFATAHLWYGILLRERGRLAEAGEEMTRAAELDPLSPVVKVNLAVLHTYRRDYERALQECDSAIELFPAVDFLHSHRAGILLLQGKTEEAMTAVRRARELAKDTPNWLDMEARVMAAKGDQAAVRKILEDLQEWSRKGYTVSAQIAMVYIVLKEYDRALEAAHKALGDKQWVGGLLYDPALDEMRRQPGFPDLLRSAGLEWPPLSQARTTGG